MISDQINQLIDQVKQHPNSESRNSLLGRLKDARAHAFVLEREDFLGVPGVQLSKISIDEGKNVCICPAPGVRSKSCSAPVHK